MFFTGQKSEPLSCAGWEREAAELNLLEVSPPELFVLLRLKEMGTQGKKETGTLQKDELQVMKML